MARSVIKLNDAIEKAEELSFEDQEILIDLLRHRHIEKRREQIAANAQKTLKQYKANQIKTGTAKDLKKDLDND